MAHAFRVANALEFALEARLHFESSSSILLNIGSIWQITLDAGFGEILRLADSDRKQI